MTPVVSWALLARDGTTEKGRGPKPPEGWFDRAACSLGAAIQFPGCPPVYAVRPRFSCDVECGLRGDGQTQELARWWGIKPEPGAQVWFGADGSMIGIGRDTTEVQRLVAALQGKLDPEKVSRGHDQRGQS